MRVLHYAGNLYPEAAPGVLNYKVHEMEGNAEKIPKEKARPVSPCGNSCQYFMEKTCPGDDTRCALYWRFSEGLE
jgi:hypothetical protein